jgi:D-alanyl-D-alanine carboxypeptidase
MGFGVDETYTLEDMLYGMLLPSGNDAANAIARSLGAQPGDSEEEAVQRFLDLMNQRVLDMGLQNTHFMNPHGWGEDGHYSSAADVAAFSRLVTNYPVLMEIMGTRSYTTSNGALTVTNTNRSLTLYDSVIAGKTGYDWEAGYCLLNFAQRGDTEIIAVTLDGVAPDDWYDDNATLLEYGFEQQAVVQAEGGAFDGDVLEFTDPSAAEIARSAQPSGEFATSNSTPEPVQPTDVPATVTPAPATETPEPEPRPESANGGGISSTTAWVAAFLAIVVLVGAGAQAWLAAHRSAAPTGSGEQSMPAGDPAEQPVDNGNGSS